MRQVLNFLKSHINIVIALCVFMMVFINQWVVKYQNFIWLHLILALAFALGVYAFSFLLHWLFDLDNNKRKFSIEFISTKVVGWMPYLILICAIVVYFQKDLPLTPYPRIDAYLHQIDQFFGFNELEVVMYFDHHLAYLLPYIQWVYNQLNNEVMLTIIFLPMFHFKSFERMFRVFFILVGITIIFYYFFPSYGPAYYFTDYRFSHELEHQLILEHALLVDPTQPPVYGVIAAPSWHVISGLLLIAAWWPVKRFGIRYIVLIFNILLILSIFPLGQHYLADALMSFILVPLVYYLDRKLIRGKLVKSKGTLNSNLTDMKPAQI
ncbi:phosphatase PAP2 family protein [Thiotrichales bacterium 19X7-9]|nr:phosphatase PAP2 family protein [Thiotrichales bacterium 19X7-9]